MKSEKKKFVCPFPILQRSDFIVFERVILGYA